MDAEASLSNLLGGLGHPWEVPVETLMSAVLPAPTLSAESVQHYLMQGDAPILTASGRAEVSPNQDQPFHNATFVRFNAILDGINNVAALSSSYPPSPALKPSIIFQYNDLSCSARRSSGWLTITDSTYPPNARGETLDVPRRADIVLSFEGSLRSGKEDCILNAKHALQSMHDIMREDVRRRFTFALTIEGSCARVWFVDRSAILYSTKFDVHKDPGILIRLFISLAFASESELGYDPTMKRISIWDGEVIQIQYEIDVNSADSSTSKTFITTKLISDTSPYALLGPATRVWEVYDKEDQNDHQKKHYALKDTWVDSNFRQEGGILKEIKSALRNSDDQRHFLTMVVDGIVPTPHPKYSNLNDSDKGSGIHRSHKVCSAVPLKPLATDPLASAFAIQHQHRRQTRQPNKHSRNHYRIVFEEIGVSVQDSANLQDAFLALHGGMKGVTLMHSLGFVHRDVSAGNVMLVKRPGEAPIGVIIDLEYAKSDKDVLCIDEPPVGTFQFMAGEASSCQYHYNIIDEEYLLDILDGKRKADPDPVFRHHPLNDLESGWWVGVWLLSIYRPASEPTSIEQARHYYKLFRGGGYYRTLRNQFFRQRRLVLAPFPMASEPVWNPLARWGSKLVDSYVSYEETRREWDLSAVPFSNQLFLDAGAEMMSYLDHVKIGSTMKDMVGFRLTDIENSNAITLTS